jgi:hypothetical protein
LPQVPVVQLQQVEGNEEGVTPVSSFPLDGASPSAQDFPILGPDRLLFEDLGCMLK